MANTKAKKARTVNLVRLAAPIANPPIINTSMSIFDLVQWTFGGAIILCFVMAFEGGLIFGILGRSDVDYGKLIDEWAMTTFLMASAVSFLVVIFGWAIYVNTIASLVKMFGQTTVNLLLGTTNKRKAAFLSIGLIIGLVILSSTYLLAVLGF